MPVKTGTYTIADLLENTFATTSVVELGMENILRAIQEDLRIHNERTNEMISQIAEISTERSTVYGTNAEGEMHKKDEFTRGPTQKVSVGSKVEFPLDGFQFAVGWTADYLRRATVQDMARKQVSARQAHLRRLQRDIKEALFGATNFTYVDRLVDGNNLAVKRLVNADSAPIPNGPNGETFNAATHTHYDGIDWSAADAAARIAFIQGLIQDVVEHGHGDDVRLYINRAQAADVRALTPNFAPLLVPNVVPAPGGTATVGEGRLDITRLDDILIGYFDGVGVWTKPWVPANYFFVSAYGDARKPLRYRQSMIAQERGLFLAGEIVTHPLQARYMEAFHGFGVLNRTNGAIGYLGNATYAVPTFT